VSMSHESILCASEAVKEVRILASGLLITVGQVPSAPVSTDEFDRGEMDGGEPLTTTVVFLPRPAR
jgi:hypothetical protein